MGLALWKTRDTYKDMQHIVKGVGEDAYTALTNPDQNKCTDQQCDGKLVNIDTRVTFKELLMYSYSYLDVATSLWRNNTNF